MEKRIWTWLVVAASVSGLMAMAAASVTIYVFVTTPIVNELVTPTDHGTVTQGKADFLFSMLAFQAFLFFAALLPVLRYKQIIRRLPERIVWQIGNVPASIAGPCVGVCLANALSLYIVIRRAFFVLQY